MQATVWRAEVAVRQRHDGDGNRNSTDKTTTDRRDERKTAKRKQKVVHIENNKAETSGKQNETAKRNKTAKRNENGRKKQAPEKRKNFLMLRRREAGTAPTVSVLGFSDNFPETTSLRQHP